MASPGDENPPLQSLHEDLLRGKFQVFNNHASTDVTGPTAAPIAADCQHQSGAKPSVIWPPEHQFFWHPDLWQKKTWALPIRPLAEPGCTPEKRIARGELAG